MSTSFDGVKNNINNTVNLTLAYNLSVWYNVLSKCRRNVFFELNKVLRIRLFKPVRFFEIVL